MLRRDVSSARHAGRLRREREAEKNDYAREDIGLYLQPVQHGRTVHAEFTLYYDPADEEDTSRAEKLFEDASKALSDEGAFFSRPYGSWADLAYRRCPDTVGVLKKVKSMDSDGINLLVGLWKCCMAAGHTFHVADCPKELVRLLSLYGLAVTFGVGD